MKLKNNHRRSKTALKPISLLLGLCSVLFCLFAGLAIGQAQQPTSLLRIGNDINNGEYLIAANNVLSIRLNLQDAQDVGAATIAIDFDPSVVDLVSCTVLTRFDGGFCNANHSPSRMEVNLIDESGFRGEAPLVDLFFRPVSSAQPNQRTELVISADNFADRQGVALPLLYKNGSITIMDPNGPTLTPTPSPTPTGTPIPTNTSPPTITPTPTISPTPNITPTPGNSVTATAQSVAATARANATPTPTTTPTQTRTPTPGNFATATSQAVTATAAALIATATPTFTRTSTPTSTITPTPANAATATAQSINATATATNATSTPTPDDGATPVAQAPPGSTQYVYMPIAGISAISAE